MISICSTHQNVNIYRINCAINQLLIEYRTLKLLNLDRDQLTSEEDLYLERINKRIEELEHIFIRYHIKK